MRGTKQLQPPPGRMGKSGRRIRTELDDAGGFSSGPIFGLAVNCVSGVWKKMTRCCARSLYRHDSAGKQTGYAIFDASGKLIERTSSLPSASVSP
jgi:hypothetical protein